MSRISDIYEALKVAIVATLPSYTQIPNPYDLQATANVMLRRGFAVAIGPAANLQRDLSCQFQVERQMAVVLTRQMSATENNVAGRQTVEKAILEDQYLLIKELENNWDLNNPDQTAAKATYDSDTGIEILATDEGGEFLVLTSIFTFRYFENLQP